MRPEKKFFIRIVFYFISVFLLNFSAFSGDLPKLFLNCATYCDESFIKFELSSFSFTRDRFQSDIEIYLTSKQSGNGGALNQVQFEGKNRYQGINDTINYLINGFDTEDEKRTKFLKVIELGLLKFISKEDLISLVNISLNKVDTSRIKQIEKDKWNMFIFNIGSSVKASGESNSRNIEMWNWLGTDRVTEQSKLGIWADFYLKNSFYRVDNQNFTATNFEGTLNSLYVRSIDDHWSLGGAYRFRSSIYNNQRAVNTAAFAAEYNFFSFKESIRRQFRFVNQLGARHLRYFQTTVFDKDYEIRPFNKFSTLLDFNQPWGTIRSGLHYSTYLDNFAQNRITLANNIELKVVKGLYLGLFGSASIINDQISLAKAQNDVGATLLRAQQLATSFSFDAYFEINYTFGSLNNSVVNQRMTNID
jgi:hypothetical protein